MPNHLPRSTALLTAILSAGCGSTAEVELELGQAPQTGEDGSQVEVTVTLARRPLGTVTIYALSSDPSEGSPAQAIQFDGRDWQRPKRLTITGVDDGVVDGDVPYEVSFYARSAGQPARLVGSVALVNVDDETMRFDALGDFPGGDEASYASDLSSTGEVLVGWSRDQAGDRALRWTPSTGLVALGGPESRAQAVSPDGRIVAGSIVEPSYEGGRAGVRWLGAQAAEVLEGPRIPGGGPLTMFVVDGKVVRDDGHVYGTCIQAGAYGEPLACLYAAPGEVQIFGLGHVFAADVFDNVAGTRQAERHAPFQSSATYNSQTLPYPDGVSCSPSRGGCEAAARDFTMDGALIVGSAHLPSEAAGPTQAPMFDTAFIHDAARGARSLPDLPGGERASGAYAITLDGRVVVGFASDTDGRQAVLWIEEAPVLLKDLWSQAGGELPAGFSLSEVRAVSSDGRTFAGNGINARGNPEAFRLVLPSAP